MQQVIAYYYHHPDSLQRLRCYIPPAWLSLSPKEMQPDGEHSPRWLADERTCTWDLQHPQFLPCFLSSSAQHHKPHGRDFSRPCRHRRLCAFPLRRAHTQKPVPHCRRGLLSQTRRSVPYLLGWLKEEHGEGGGVPQGCSCSTQGISEPTFPWVVPSRSSRDQNWHCWYRSGMRQCTRLPPMSYSDSAPSVKGYLDMVTSIGIYLPASQTNHWQIVSRLNWLLGFKLHRAKSGSTERL